MANERTKCPLTDDQIKHMVNRFLGWKLPEDFQPDAGISFDIEKCRYGPNVHFPSGTNLFHAGQAEAMIRYMVEGIQHGGVCLWCGFSTTKGSLDELADAIYAHLGECDASPVPALIRERDAALAQVGVLREALQEMVEWSKWTEENNKEVGELGQSRLRPLFRATVGREKAELALSNTSATAQQFVERIEWEALEKADANVRRILRDAGRSQALIEWVSAAILGEKGKG